MRLKGLAIFLLALVCLLASCGGDSEGAADSPQGSSSAAKDPQEITMGISMYTLGAPYFAAQAEAAKNLGESMGMTVYTTNAQGDMNKQIADVEDLLARNIDILILNPLDPLGLVPATKFAAEAGVPVIIIDSSIDDSADFVTTIQSNNLLNGELVGNWLARQMRGTRMNIALISGAQGNPVGKERRQGVIRGIVEEQFRMEGESGFNIVAQGWGNWGYEGGLNAMEDILVAHPEINVLLTENDSMALGAMEALKEAGRLDDVLVLAAADGQKEALALIQKGEYGATGLNNPKLIAEKAVELGVEVLNGNRDLPKVTYTPPAAITIENVADFYDPNAVF